MIFTLTNYVLGIFSGLLSSESSIVYVYLVLGFFVVVVLLYLVLYGEEFLEFFFLPCLLLTFVLFSEGIDSYL